MVQDTLTLFGPDWPRREHFAYYRQKVICGYSVTALLEVSGLYHWCRQKQQKFFSAVTYCAARAIASLPEFCMGLDEMGRPGYYPRMHPSYTVFHPQSESFTVTWSVFDSNFAGFYQRYLQDAQRALQHQEGFESAAQPVSQLPITPPNLFDVSCIPWASFTSFHLNIKPGYEHLLPIFTLGQFTQQAGNIQLPLAIQVHHAACDGFHVARFVKELQTWTEDFSVE